MRNIFILIIIPHNSAAVGCASQRLTEINQVNSMFFTLKNSVDKHLQDKDMKALKKRINTTVDELKKLAKEL